MSDELTLMVCSFAAALAVSIVSSVWMRPELPLGRPYWVLTLVVTSPALLVLLLALVEPRDVWALLLLLFFFGPIAAGWLTGTAITLLARIVRAEQGRC